MGSNLLIISSSSSPVIESAREDIEEAYLHWSPSGNLSVKRTVGISKGSLLTLAPLYGTALYTFRMAVYSSPLPANVLG